MYKISFQIENQPGSLIIYFYTEERLSMDTLRKGVALSYDYQDKKNIIKLDNLAMYLKKNDFKIILKQLRRSDLIVQYDSQKDILSFYYGKTVDMARLNCEDEYYIYKIGEETIVRIDVVSFSKYLVDKEIKKEFFTKKILIDEEEKETVSHYTKVLERYEKSFKKAENISKAKSYLQYMENHFPLISGAYINAIEEELKDLEFPELQECVINLKEMQRKEIKLEPLLEAPKEDEAEEYADQYDYSKGNLVRAFDDNQIDRVPKLEKQKLKEAQARIGRVRRIMEVRYKFAKPEEKVKIVNYITVIKRFETKTFYISKEEEKKTLDNILAVLDGISVLVVGIPKAIIESVVKIVRAVKALINLAEDYEKEKDEEEERKRRKTLERQEEYQEETYIPQIPSKKLTRQPKPVYVRDYMKVEIVGKILRQHGPMTIIGIIQCARGYNYIISKEQIQGAVYQSDRFRSVGKRRIYRGVKPYNVYAIKKS